jgi:DNA polymerase delta subunit 1
MKRNGANNNTTGPKKTKVYDENEFNFDEDLAWMEDVMFEKIDDSEGNDTTENQSLRWNRPNNLPDFNSKKNSISFHWLDIDMITGKALESNPDGGAVIGARDGVVPVVRLYGVTQEGLSVMACVHGFTPYFYASFPSTLSLSDNILGQLRVTLDQKV